MRSRLAIVLLMASVGIGCAQNGPSSKGSTPPAKAQNLPQPTAKNSDTRLLPSQVDLVRQAITDHVKNDQEINLSAMDMSVDSVKLNGDQAQANVTFRLRQGSAAMAMIYSLERHGTGWQVVKSQPDGQFVHPPIDPTHLGPPSNPSGPAMPDVEQFLRDHPATSSN